MANALRKNRAHLAPQDIIVVAGGDQSLATGVFNTAGNSYNLLDAQLGLKVFGHDWTAANGAYMAAATTALQVGALQVVQGTPNSGNLANANVFGTNAPGAVRSGIINAQKIRSVITTLPTSPILDMQLMKAFTNVVEDVDYRFSVTLESHKRDIGFTSQKRDQLVANTRVPVGTTADTDYALQLGAAGLNTQSLTTVGNRPFVVLGLNMAGGAGTVIGTSAAGDVVPFMLHDGTTYNITLDTTWIASLQEAIGVDAALNTATIEVIDVLTAGAAAKVDALLFVGLDEIPAVAFDDSLHTKVRVFGAVNDLLRTNTEVATAKEGTGQGSIWKQKWYKRMGLYIHDLANVGHDYDLTIRDLYNPIVDASLYTSTIIEFFNDEATMTLNERTPHTLTFLIPASLTNPTATADPLTPFVFATSDSTTVTELNAALGVWLASASDNFSQILYKSGASAATPFV